MLCTIRLYAKLTIETKFALKKTFDVIFKKQRGRSLRVFSLFYRQERKLSSGETWNLFLSRVTSALRRMIHEEDTMVALASIVSRFYRRKTKPMGITIVMCYAAS